MQKGFVIASIIFCINPSRHSTTTKIYAHSIKDMNSDAPFTLHIPKIVPEDFKINYKILGFPLIIFSSAIRDL